MRRLTGILGLILVISAIFALLVVYQDAILTYLDPTLYDAKINAQQAKLAAEAAYADDVAARWNFFWTMTTYAVTAVVVGGLGLLGVRGYVWVSRSITHLSPVQGVLPTIIRDTANFLQRLRGEHNFVILQPQQAIGGMQAHRIAPGQQPVSFRLEGTEQPALLQTAILAGRDGVVASYTQRTRAQGKLPTPPVPKIPTGAPPLQLTVDDDSQGEPEEFAAPAVPLPTSASEALRLSENGRVVLGTISQRQPVGEAANVPADMHVAIWDSNEARQIGIFGANGTGKTKSVAALIILAAIRWGWHVVILDPKRGADWRNVFEPFVERHDSGPEEMLAQLQVFMLEVQRRQDLCAKYGVGDIADLPPDLKQRPILLVLEELGDTRAQLRTLGKEAREEFDALLSTLMRITRYVDIRVVIIDQRPENWPAAVKGNLKALVTFRQGMNQGQAVGYYYADRLAKAGQFAMDGIAYDTWLAHPQAAQLLAKAVQMPALPDKVLTWRGVAYPKLIVAQASENEGTLVPASPVKEGAEVTPVRVLKLEDGREIEVDTSHSKNALDSVDPWSIPGMSTQARVSAYIAQNPMATQGELVRVLKINPGMANRWWHDYHDQG